MSTVSLTHGHQSVPQTASYRQIASDSGHANSTAAAGVVNLSGRANVGIAENVLIGGFIISGTSPKEVLVRATGSSSGVNGALADPVLELHGSEGFATIINDNWQDANNADEIPLELKPGDPLEAAILVTLSPGAYTGIVRGKNDTVGVGLVEIYDVSTAEDSQLSNVSTRAFVQTGDNVLIGGFITFGDANPNNIVVRAIGPSLLDQGVPNPLGDPKLSVYNGDGSLIRANDFWYDDADADKVYQAGLAPSDGRESAIYLNVVPGAYTAIVDSYGVVDPPTGVGLVEIYSVPDDPVTGIWSSTGSLATARRYHTATLLANGNVLAAGGNTGASNLASAELYDAATGTWSNTGSLADDRSLHTATLLPSGEVLVTGGFTGSMFTEDYLSSAELYDPETGTWSSAGDMATKRYGHTATLLADGKILVGGGNAVFLVLADSELFDPATGTWLITGSLANARWTHTATRLPDGKVLVAGGTDDGGGRAALASGELYDPATGTWSTTGSMATARRLHTATLLPNGKVLVAGGVDSKGSLLASAELYDPATGTWSNTGDLVFARDGQTATLLSNDRVLVAGGYSGLLTDLSRGELYDSATEKWSSAGDMANARVDHTATLLSNGRVLAAGGENPSILSSAELYDIGL